MRPFSLSMSELVLSACFSRSLMRPSSFETSSRSAGVHLRLQVVDAAVQILLDLGEVGGD